MTCLTAGLLLCFCSSFSVVQALILLKRLFYTVWGTLLKNNLMELRCVSSNLPSSWEKKKHQITSHRCSMWCLYPAGSSHHLVLGGTKWKLPNNLNCWKNPAWILACTFYKNKVLKSPVWAILPCTLENVCFQHQEGHDRHTVNKLKLML